MDAQIGSSAASNNPGFFRFISIPLRWLILCLICCVSIFSTYSSHHIYPLANRVGGDFAPPKRPNIGSLGRAIALRTNFFQVRLPKGDIHHYDLSISPDKCPRRVNRDVVEAMVNTYHKVFGGQRPVFDGRKNLYSSKALPIGRKPVSDLQFACLCDLTVFMTLKSFYDITWSAKINVHYIQHTLHIGCFVWNVWSWWSGRSFSNLKSTVVQSVTPVVVKFIDWSTLMHI